MEREILFRGKRLDNGEWIDGDYISSSIYPDRAWITESKTFYDKQLYGVGVREVDPSIVGQCTGLTDKNGVKIFEGDIMEFDSYGSHCQGIVTVIGGNFCILCGKVAGPYVDRALECLEATLIGNVHDYPEFLEVHCKKGEIQ